MTIADLINSPDHANFEVALAAANLQELKEIAEMLKDQELLHRKAFEKAMRRVDDCRKNIARSSGSYDLDRALAIASNTRSAQWAVLEKRKAVQKAINEKHK